MDPVIGVLVVALVGPLVTYLVAVRRLSGKVASSEATELWAESKSIRDWSSARITELNGVVSRLEMRVARCEGQNDKLVRENENLVQCVKTLRAKIVELEAQVNGHES